jgi:hypothetical protein
MQNKNSGTFPHKEFLFRAKTAMSIDDFTFVPSCPANLGLGIMYLKKKEGVIQFAKTTACSTKQLPEGAAKVKTMAAFALYPYPFVSHNASLLNKREIYTIEVTQRE